MWRVWIVLVGSMMAGAAGGLWAIRAGGPSSAQWVAYVADDTLYLVSSDGGVRRRVTALQAGITQGVAWQGDQVIFQRFDHRANGGDGATLYARYDPQTATLRPSADAPPPRTTQPDTLSFNRLSVWQAFASPDGEWLVVVAYDVVPTTRPQTRGVFRVHPDGSELLRLSPLTLFNDAYDPAWSPDGEWVVFTAHIRNDDNLFKVRVDGSDLHQLTRNAAYDQTAHWSADNRWIIFTSDRTGYVQLYRVPANGTEADVQPITNFPADIRRGTMALSPSVDVGWRGWSLGLGVVTVLVGIGLLSRQAASRYT